MIYFDENKQTYGFKIEEPVCMIEDEIWEKYAGRDNWDIIDGQFIDITDTEEYKEKVAQKERERLNTLSLTAADVERALYKARNLDFDDVLELVKDNPDIDFKALKIELKANNFYRGNPLISSIGAVLGISETQLDEFFETNDYTKLLPEDNKETEGE